jgi:CHAD domain-containing protein
VAKARPIEGLSAEVPYARAAARVVSVRAAELRQHAEGVLDVSEIERVHDMRVATRRLRAALEVFRPCFPRRLYRATLGEVKSLADALGERRDRDVTIAALGQIAETMDSADRPGLESLIGALRAEQSRANEALAPRVTSERLDALVGGLDQLAAEAEAAAR